MTTAAWVVLGVFAVVAPLDWWAVHAHGRSEMAWKPAATTALVVLAAVITPLDATQRAWFVAALVASLAGDVLLMVPRDLFVAGLASFLLAHLAYIAGFAARGLPGARLAIALAASAVVLALVAVPILRAVRRSQPAALVGAVVVYMAVITAMLASAFAVGVALAAAGAALFTLSDSLLARDRFVRPWAWASVAVMITYHLGQLGLTLSLLR